MHSLRKLHGATTTTAAVHQTLRHYNHLMSFLFLPSLQQQHRSVSTTNAVLGQNHYSILGLTPKATQTDVKSAYYKLSMVYHPDKNEGCADAADKFRAITSAYEVLSSYRLRRLYDKGIIHTAGPQFADEPPMDEAPQSPVKDDPQTQFYKRHMSRTEAPHASGRTPIYDFDAWTEAHYGKTFARRQTAQNRYRNKQHDDTVEMNGRKSEILIFGMLSCFFGFFFVFLQWDKSSLDVPAATAADRKK